MNMLIVENRLRHLEEVLEYLRKVFQGTHFLTAGTSEDARATVEAAVRENRDIHVAVLDLHLAGKPDNFDLKLVYFVRERFPESLILLYTVHDQHHLVRQLAEVRHFAHDEIIQKKSAQGGRPAVRKAIREYWEYQLHQKAQSCFRPTGPSEEPNGQNGRSSRPLDRFRCDTIGVNTLLLEISDFWPNFSEKVRERMAKLVDVVEGKDGRWHATPRR